MKKFTQNIWRRKKAFSLIELSVVIVILSIIVSGMLSVSVSSSINNKAEVTQNHIDEIYNALGAYLLKNGALPCPAPITSLFSNDPDYGTAAATAGTCYDIDGVYEHHNFAYGMVPVKTLGLASDVSQDGYGNKFGYLVYKDFTNSDHFGDLIYSNGIDVKNKNISLLDGDLAVFAIISYGANKSGAFNANSATQNELSSDIAETKNYPTKLGPAQITLASDMVIFAESTSSNDTITLQAASASDATIFDDVIFFKSRNELVRDFNALHLVRCPAISNVVSDPNYITYDSGVTYMGFASGGYNQIIVSDTNCPNGYKTTVQKPARRCGTYGVWEVSSEHNGANIAIPCTDS